MSHRQPLLLLLAALLAVPAFGFLAPDEGFKPPEYEGIGKALATYFSARNDNKGIDKAQEALVKEVDQVGKRMKREPLSLPGEMGKSLWASYGYDKQQKIKRGKVDVIDIPAYYDVKAKFAYAVWIPVKYNAKQAYPVILCIPEKGETPQAHLTEKWVDASIRENAILVAVPMPDDAAAWLEASPPTKQSGAGNMLMVLREVRRTYALDFDRLYIAGRGAGVEAALTYAARFPDRFAGVIGRSGDIGEVTAENLRNLPIFLAGAGAKATALEEKLKKLAYENILQRKDDAQEADVWAWMQAHPRISYPTEVVLYPGTPEPKLIAWLEAVPNDAQGSVYIKGKIDRATNTITIEGEGVTKFNIYFNDVLVDMDKPVKVVANGAEVSRTVKRSLPRLLDFVYSARSDPGRMFTNVMAYDLPAKPKPPPGKAGDPK
jgi:hypothetical protein